MIRNTCVNHGMLSCACNIKGDSIEPTLAVIEPILIAVVLLKFIKNDNLNNKVCV